MLPQQVLPEPPAKRTPATQPLSGPAPWEPSSVDSTHVRPDTDHPASRPSTNGDQRPTQATHPGTRPGEPGRPSTSNRNPSGQTNVQTASPPAPPTTRFLALPGDLTAAQIQTMMGDASSSQAQRLESERRQHRELLGKFQPHASDLTEMAATEIQTRFCPPLSSFFPPPLPSRYTTATVPQDVLRALRVFPQVPEAPIRPSPFQYSRTIAAATHNSELFVRFNYDPQRLIDAYPGSILSPGCEFQSVPRLRVLLGRHPFWPILEKMMTSGVHFDLISDVDDSARRIENDALLSRGNHKSAREAPNDLHAEIEKDTIRGFSIPLLRETILRIPEARVAPMGIARQMTVTASGERKPKLRLTHDQSFSTGVAPSVNDIANMDELPELVFGWAIHRIIHQIVALREKYPFDEILICKFDYSSAYRRLTMDGVTSARSMTVDEDGIAHMPTRCTFGGSPNPAFFSAISEPVTDLANDVLKATHWSPPLPPEPIRSILSSPILLDEDILHATAQRMAVSPDPAPEGKVDVFLDDNILVFRATPENLQRAPFVIPSVIAAISRPNSAQEPLRRDAFLTLSKLSAEGAPAEVRIVLGWQIDTRRLRISLPDDKYATWNRELEALIKKPTATYEAWDSLLGRLNHAAEVLPLSRYFLGHLRAFLAPFDEKKKRTVLPPPSSLVLQDLRLWTDFLGQAHAGVSLNLLTIRTPTHILLSDACPLGMGGYSLKTGRAWQLRIDKPEDVSNNLLEFIASVVTLWIDDYEAQLPPESCVLALSDNGSAVGWLHGGNFGAARPRHTEVAHKLAYLVLDGGYCLTSSHIPGVENEVADLLSRDFSLSEDDLTLFIRARYSRQVPETFRISRPPSEIVSWVSSVLQPQPRSSLAEPPAPTAKRNLPGNGGASTVTCSDSDETPTSSTSTTRFDSPSPSRLSNSSAATDNELHAKIRSRFAQALSERPLATWCRSSGISTGEAPSTSRRLPTHTTPTSGNS